MIQRSSIIKLALVVALPVVTVIVCLVPSASKTLLSVENERSHERSGMDVKMDDESLNGFAHAHYNVVRKYSSCYGVDYRMILAVIRQESGFDRQAVSYRGAQGYMQIMPVTNAEICEELELANPHLPRTNLRAGIYYFSKLLKLFDGNNEEDRLSLALAAYNAGPSRVYDAQELAAYIGENPNCWSSVQKVLPLLSKRYYSLHEHVWDNGKPPNGYFGSWKETVNYVDNVMKTYHCYQAMQAE